MFRPSKTTGLFISFRIRAIATGNVVAAFVGPNSDILLHEKDPRHARTVMP